MLIALLSRQSSSSRRGSIWLDMGLGVVVILEEGKETHEYIIEEDGEEESGDITVIYEGPFREQGEEGVTGVFFRQTGFAPMPNNFKEQGVPLFILEGLGVDTVVAHKVVADDSI